MTYTLYFLRKNPLTIVGLMIIFIDLILVVFGPLLVPYDPTKAAFGDALRGPGIAHFFGTDHAGMDIFSRVIVAARLDLLIGVLAATISFFVGVPLGILAGFYGDRRGWTSWGSELLMRGMDVIQSFPVFIFAMVLVAMAGTSVRNVVAAVAFVNIPIFVRLLRSDALSVREQPFIDAARCAGNPEWRIALRHLLPNSIRTGLIQGSVTIGWAIILTAGLSFVGAGVPTPTPEWGLMISDGAQNMVTGQWWPALFPGLALGITVFGFAVVADSIQRVMDPTAR